MLRTYPAFSRVLFARLAATAALEILSVVVGWQLYTLTKDPLTLGYVGLVQFLPMVLLVLPAGDLSDRKNRQHVLGASWLGMALASAALLFLTLNETTATWPYFLAMAAVGLARAFSGPAMHAIVPLMVPVQLLGRAIAINSASFQMAVMVGPVVGGGLYWLGPGWAYTACMTIFIAAAGLVYFVRPLHRQKAYDGQLSALGRFTEGLSYMRRQPIILGAISLDLFAVLLGGVTALLPVFAQDILEVGPHGLGMLRAAMAAGAFVMGLFLSRAAFPYHVGRSLFVSVALFGGAILLFALSTNFLLSLFALFLAGASDMVSMFIRSTLVQLATPDEMRGRVSAVNMLFISSSNELGEFESGLTAAWFGPVNSVLIGGFGTLLVVFLWARLFPALRATERFPQP